MIWELLFFLTLFLHLLIGGIVFTKNPKNRTNQSFFLLILFLVFWTSAHFLQNETRFKNTAEILLRLDFSLGIFLCSSFYLFTQLFPQISQISLRKKLFILIPPLFFSILSFNNLIIKNIHLRNGVIDCEPGLLFPLYFLVALFYISAGIIRLFFIYKKSLGTQRIQVLYFFLGIAITAGILFVVNLVIGSVFKLSLQVYRGAIASSLAFTTFTGLAITRYHLFGIEVILTEILVGVIGISLVIQIFTAPTVLLRIVNGFLFVLFCIFGWLLIRATLREIKRREEAEKLSQAKSEFLSIVSHQLRTPLTVIKGYLSMILEEGYGSLSEKLKKVIENIYVSNERLIKLVNDFLNATRVETGKMELELERVDLEELIESQIKELEIKSKEKGIYLNFEKPKEKVPQVFVDKEKIGQVILNLIDNAIKYTHSGGITVSLEKLKDSVRIKIKDTGEGMTKKEIEKLFESFSRGTAGMKFYTEGTGLGLYISKKLVELHKGKIWAESEGIGKGSTFYVELPIK